MDASCVSHISVGVCADFDLCSVCVHGDTALSPLWRQLHARSLVTISSISPLVCVAPL